MSVTVRAVATLKRLLDGETEVEAEGATIGELLDQLGLRDHLCDETGKLRRHFHIHVNEGEDIRRSQGLDTPVKDGDVVTLLLAIAGGSRISRKAVE